MAALNEWWATLSGINHGFYIAAIFFGVIFVWQMIMALVGLGGGHDLDAHAEANWEHHSPDDAHDTVAAFKVLSIRSILAFFTLFSWAGALYLNRGLSLNRSLLYSLAWGLAAMVTVSLILSAMRRLTETGNIRTSTAVGCEGSVYLDIPESGGGEIRVMCGGTMAHLKARSADGRALKGGTPIKVLRLLDPTTVEVEEIKPADAAQQKG